MPEKPFFWESRHLTLFKDLIDQSSDAIFILSPVTGKVLYANQQACNNLEYEYSEITSLHVWDYASNVTDMEEYQVLLETMRQSGYSRFETVQRSKTGRKFPVEITLRLATCQDEDYFISSVRDISERKAFETALSTERNKLDAVMGTIEDGITVVDPEFKVLYQNATHRHIQGIQTGRPCYLAFHGKETICEGCLVAKTFEDGKIHKRQTEALNVDGKIFMEVTSCPIRDAQGEIISVVELVRNITPQKQAEEALKESIRLRSEFISIAAHELRTPLAAIYGYAELLSDTQEFGEFSEQQRQDFVQEILAKAVSLSKVIDELLDLSRLEKGHTLILEKSDVDIHLLVKDILKSFINLFPEYHFLVSIEDQISHSLELDPGKIRQALENILNNAIKYSPPGTSIRVEVIKEGPGVKIAIIDQGKGMSAAEVERIFEPFYRANPDDPTVRGLGLGMSLVKHIIESHEGNIHIESTPQAGTTVILSLPAKENSHSPPPFQRSHTFS